MLLSTFLKQRILGQSRNHKGNYKILWDEWKRLPKYQNLWDAMKAVLTDKVIPVDAYILKNLKSIH